MVADNAINGFVTDLSDWDNEFDTEAKCVFKTLSNIYDGLFAKKVNSYLAKCLCWLTTI